MLDLPVLVIDASDSVHLENCESIKGECLLLTSEGESFLDLCGCIVKDSTAPKESFKQSLHLFLSFFHVLTSYQQKEYVNLDEDSKRQLYSFYTNVHHVRKDLSVIYESAIGNLDYSALEAWAKSLWEEMNNFLSQAETWLTSKEHRHFMLSRLPSVFPDEDEILWGVIDSFRIDSTGLEYARTFQAVPEQGTFFLVRAPKKVFERIFRVNPKNLIPEKSSSLEALEAASGLFVTGGVYNDFQEAYKAAVSI